MSSGAGAVVLARGRSWLAREGRRVAYALLGAATLWAVSREVHWRPELFHRRGVSWRSSSATGGYATAGDAGAVLGGGVFFHTASEKSPWLEVDLGRVVPIESVEVTNRLDCCSRRALPLVLEVATDPGAWQQVANRRRNFVTWNASFDRRAARYVRLRVAGDGVLHLTDLAIR